METADKLISTPATTAFELKGSLFTLTIMHFNNADISKIEQQLAKTVEQAPNFFQQAPVVLNFSKLSTPLDDKTLETICALLKDNGMIPVGIAAADDQLKQLAKSQQLALFPRTTTEKPATNTQSTNQPTAQATKIITQPVRSGQQIYAKGADLIVIASVSNGAEVLADGNIHIYGTLKGRALAGINGDKSARIFCNKLDAELVSIAGLYQLSEDFAQKQQSDQSIQIYLHNDRLCITEVE